MTLDEARHAGDLVRAIDALDATLKAAKRLKDKDEWLEIALSHDVSDAGATGVRPGVIVPPEMALAAMNYVRVCIVAELAKIGVDE